MLNKDSMLDEDTRLGDLLPVELISALQSKSSTAKPYVESLEDRVTHLKGMIEAFEVMGDAENLETYTRKLMELPHD